jgi:hypothetical protein
VIGLSACMYCLCDIFRHKRVRLIVDFRGSVCITSKTHRRKLGTADQPRLDHGHSHLGAE